MNYDFISEVLNESDLEHIASESLYECNECEEGKSPLVVRVRVDGHYRMFKCCPDCGEELESV